MVDSFWMPRSVTGHDNVQGMGRVRAEVRQAAGGGWEDRGLVNGTWKQRVSLYTEAALPPPPEKKLSTPALRNRRAPAPVAPVMPSPTGELEVRFTTTNNGKFKLMMLKCC